MMSPGEDWIELGQSKELISFAAHRIIYRCGHQGGTFSDDYRDPEEKVRAGFFVELVERYQYPPERIDFEVEVPRREPVDKADIVVYRDDALKTPHCVVECKQHGISEAEIEQAVKQAGGNANNLGAPYGMMVAGSVRVVFQSKEWDPRRPLESGNIADLPVRYGQPPKYRYWKQRDDRPDLAVMNESQLRDAFQQCHDILWEGGRRNPAQAFDEMSKLMFCKLQDERLRTGIGGAYAFQCGTNETADKVKGRVQEIYKDAQDTAPSVFQRSIEAQAHLVYRVVQVLQGISLDRMDLDVKGAAFEKFLGVVFRGEMGQYFTHRNLVNFMVEMLEPNRRDKMIDPACGSGGFLLQAMERVRKREEKRLGKEHGRDLWKNWALRRLHGIEINEQISRVAMMDMIIHEDGHTNIKCTDALQTWDAVNGLKDGIHIEPATYTLLMTNPPFGAKVTRVRKGAEHPYLDTYELGGKVRRRNSQKTEILFIERCLQLLAPGGRMGIVVPDGILTNSSLQYVRDFIMRETRVLAVVSLPQHTFVPAKSAVKASLLFLRKWKEGEDREQDYPIFMAMAEHVGYTATGREDDNDLPAILDAYRQFKREHAGFFLSSPLCLRVERGELEQRLDAQFYQPQYLELDGRLRQCRYPALPLRDLALKIVDGPFGSQLKVEEYVPAGIPLVRVFDVKTGELVDDGLVFITPEKQGQLKRSRVLPGDVILTKAGAILGYSAVFPDRWAEGNITSHSVSIRCKDIVRNRYLSLYLKSEFGNRQIYRWGSKSTRPELNTQEVGRILVVVPPLDVQDAISDRMDAAYGRKRELEAEAKALLDSIDGYVSTELGTEWGRPPDRGKPVGYEAVWFGAWRQHVKRLDPKRYRYQREEPLAKGMRRLGDLLTWRREKVDRSKYAFADLQLISLHFDGTMSPRDVQPWRKDIKGTLWFAYPGDLVYSKIDARNGAIGLVPDELGRIAVTSEYPVYRVKDGISAEYLKIVLRAPQFTNLLKAMAAGHSGRKRIQPSELEDVSIPVASLDRQQEILVEVENRRDRAAVLCEEAGRVVADAKAQVERMTLGKE